jgi:hypothetical protein
VETSVARLKSQIWEFNSQIALNGSTEALSKAADTIQGSATALSTASIALHEALRPELFQSDSFTNEVPAPQASGLRKKDPEGAAREGG